MNRNSHRTAYSIKRTGFARLRDEHLLPANDESIEPYSAPGPQADAGNTSSEQSSQARAERFLRMDHTHAWENS
jgi:hypothetical protein